MSFSAECTGSPEKVSSHNSNTNNSSCELVEFQRGEATERQMTYDSTDNDPNILIMSCTSVDQADKNINDLADLLGSN